MFEVEPIYQHMAVIGSGRNGNEAVASAASETFVRWMHRRYAAVELASEGHIVSPRDIYAVDPRDDSRQQVRSGRCIIVKKCRCVMTISLPQSNLGRAALPPHLTHPSSADPTHQSPPQTASRSNQPFLHNTLSGQTDGPTDGLGDKSVYQPPRLRWLYCVIATRLMMTVIADE